MGSFGEKLRKQREQRGLALDAISNSTKISTRMLRALEEEHFDQLPGGVFNKGFVRAYARQVGLNEEEAVSEYLAALRENQVQSQQILPDLRHPGSNTRTVTPHDSRHHILPAGDHPGGDNRSNGSHDVAIPDVTKPDLTNEERRKQERRAELRRSQDREGKLKDRSEARHEDQRVSSASHLEKSGKGGLARAESSSEPEISKHESKGNINNRISDDRQDADRDQPRSGRSDSLRGFITLGADVGGAAEPDEGDTRPYALWIAAAALLLLVVVSLALWASRRHSDIAPASSASSSSPSSSANLAVAQPIAQPGTSAPSTASANRPKPEAAPATAKAPDRKPEAASSSPLASKASSTTPAVKPSPGPAPLHSADTNVKADAFAKPASTFSLLVRAEQTTWISITADGKPVIHETLIAPAHTSVRATHDVSVRVGNAAGVSFQLSGKEIPSQGAEGEVRTYSFDASGLKSTAQTPPQTQPQ